MASGGTRRVVGPRLNPKDYCQVGAHKTNTSRIARSTRRDVIELTRDQGLDVGVPVNLRSTNNVVTWMRPSPVVAEMARDVDASARELQLATSLVAIGVPVVPPIEIGIAQPTCRATLSTTWRLSAGRSLELEGTVLTTRRSGHLLGQRQVDSVTTWTTGSCSSSLARQGQARRQQERSLLPNHHCPPASTRIGSGPQS